MEELKVCVFGGYDKLETLQYIDLLTSEVCMLEAALESKNKGERFTIPAEAEERELKISPIGGFDKEDTERYIGELRAKSAELRNKLLSA